MRLHADHTELKAWLATSCFAVMVLAAEQDEVWSSVEFGCRGQVTRTNEDWTVESGKITCSVSGAHSMPGMPIFQHLH